ncbi:TPA: hypothetical protein U6I48_004823 [Klebsiella aerogenes]|nr:hypothetical protein [Klebsiella aerogenes]
MNTVSFYWKLAFVFFLLSLVCFAAGMASWYFWGHMFSYLGYELNDFATLDAENQAMKTPLNLVMYVIPSCFYVTSLGLLLASVISGVADIFVTMGERFFAKRACRSQ